MSTRIQDDYWNHPTLYQKKVQWNTTKPHIYSNKESFLQLHKSRKGTHLNIPEQFYTTPFEQQCIGKIPILSAGGCCDMEYVMRRQNARKRQLFTMQNQTYYTNEPQYSPSVTINIGTPAVAPPLNHTKYHRTFQRNISYSTVSINPSTVPSEEPWQQKQNVIPLGLYCCENRNNCEHTPSVEQRVIHFEGAGDRPENPNQSLDDKGFVYVTSPPTISPLTACWNFLSCKKKRRHGEVYMPTAMTKAEPKECRICPKCSKTDNASSHLNGPTRTYGVAPKLSTITESEITVSEYSSEEFISQEEKEKREKMEKKRFVYPEKTYTGTGRVLDNSSLNSGIYSSSFFPPGQIYRWVCEPTEEKKNRFFNRKSNKKFICYKEALED